MDSHTAYIEYLSNNFERSNRYKLLPAEAKALADCHQDLAGYGDRSDVANSYRSFVDYHNEKEALEPHLSMMLEDLTKFNDQRYTESIARELVEMGWRKINADER